MDPGNITRLHAREITMGFKQKQAETSATVEKPKLKDFQLDLIEREIFTAGGEQKWLIAKGALKRINENEMAVVMKSDGSIPYTELAEQARQVMDRKSRREYAERMRIYQQTGEMPISPALKELRAKLGFTVKRV